MITTSPAPGVSLVHAAERLAAHLATHELPQPASLAVLSGRAGQTELTTQLPSSTMAEIAADLLAWAETLTTVTIEAWRPPNNERVHLTITSTLTGPIDPVELEVFASAEYDPALLPDLGPGETRTLSLGILRTWALPDARRGQR